MALKKYYFDKNGIPGYYLIIAKLDSIIHIDPNTKFSKWLSFFVARSRSSNLNLLKESSQDFLILSIIL